MPQARTLFRITIQRLENGTIVITIGKPMTE